MSDTERCKGKCIDFMRGRRENFGVWTLYMRGNESLLRAVGTNNLGGLEPLYRGNQSILHAAVHIRGVSDPRHQRYRQERAAGEIFEL